MSSLAERLSAPQVALREEAARQVLALATFDLEVEVADALAPEVLAHGAAVLALVRDAAPSVRALGCAALGELATLHLVDDWPPARPLAELAVRGATELRGAVDDPELTVRLAAIAALGQLRAVSRAPRDLAEAEARAVAAHLGDLAPAVRAAAVHSLVAQLGRDAECWLAPIVDNVDDEVAVALLDALAPLGCALATPLLLRRLRADGAAAQPRHVELARRVPLAAADAREVLRPLTRADLPREVREAAARALIEHVDGSYLDALAALARLGDQSSLPALAALARLGRGVPAEALTRFTAGADGALRPTDPADPADPARRLNSPTDAEALATGRVAVATLERPAEVQLRYTAWTLAAADRDDLVDQLVAALPLARRPAYGLPRSDATPSPGSLLRLLALFEHPAIAEAVLPFAREPGPLPERIINPETERYSVDLAEAGLACLALGASGGAAALPAIQRVRGALARLPSDNRLARLRHRADLALALVDADALESFLEHDNGWPPRLFTFEKEHVLLALTFRRLGRRLERRARPLAAGARALVASIVRLIDTTDVAEAILAFRGLHPTMSGNADFTFFVREVYAEARARLEPALRAG
ncbi:MAG: hypothetical protein R3B48_24650 [Kofleriaceae bacterium]